MLRLHPLPPRSLPLPPPLIPSLVRDPALQPCKCVVVRRDQSSPHLPYLGHRREPSVMETCVTHRELHISLIQLLISTIHLVISPIQLMISAIQLMISTLL